MYVSAGSDPVRHRRIEPDRRHVAVVPGVVCDAHRLDPPVVSDHEEAVTVDQSVGDRRGVDPRSPHDPIIVDRFEFVPISSAPSRRPRNRRW
ncbi:hypothetical protein BRD17_09875 [Halobacteriales archaeon SW_7_68_16]|nr:MAG: hypothetical protein BRD17_09875 [Halobacteriales archaeon SW_7_68_16]